MRYRILKELVYSLEYNKEWEKGILLGILNRTLDNMEVEY